ncbi:AraC family transcriptional regulator [Nodosilinea sp. LEGE 07298]|uniref:AraC family transcriptional regulator n=1 Tax=Nodosilinea sp. LEGE 07298 TaxID=2777970 RepID=UPI001880D9B7|nr:AraC family transcriptional regulator [Nodosilinea sp. LEGE 07298]MBE9110890.1 AraC family transcriptional regulator [Nodosilinea sp. LEGE 07298]
MREQAKAWRSPIFTHLEVLHATYRTHAFARHVHEDFCVGIIVDGVEAVKYRGATHTAPKGSIVVLQPGEGHSNWAAVEAGWSFHVIYPPAGLFQALMVEEAEQKTTLPFFAEPVICDRPLFRQLARAHTRLAQPMVEDCLSLETHLLTLLRTLVRRHAVHSDHSSQRPQAEHSMVQPIKHYLETHYGQRFTLDDLSQQSGLSPYYLTRVFRAAVGLPPHSYLTYLRITKAKQRLRQETSLTQLALELGFVDQSHFTKTFKAWVGVTPGQYCRQLNG